MEKFTSELLLEMSEALQKIAVEAENFLQKAERSFYVVENVISKLKDFITIYKFKDKEEEVRFFKEVKPEFQKELIYFEEALYLEAGRPVGSQKANKRYTQRELQRIESYFEKNSYLYNYYRAGEIKLDEHYFVRQSVQIPLLPVSFSDIDTSFSTPYSHKLATLKAYERLKDHLSSSLVGKVVNAEEDPGGYRRKGRNRVWTGPKAALSEIILGAEAKGYINYGESSLKELVEDFEQFFNVRLGNVYRVFLGMTIRKKGYTPYLDGMKEAIENKIRDKHE